MKKTFISPFFVCLVLYSHWGLSQPLAFVGNASLESGNPSNCIQITPLSSNEKGFAWSTERFDLSQDQSMDFNLYLGDMNNGGDGLVFVLHNDPRGLDAVGCKGQALGYGQEGFMVDCDDGNGGTDTRISPSIGIEVDIFSNSDWSEIANDHLAFVQNGVNNHGTTNLNDIQNGHVFPNNIEDDQLHLFRVTWEAATETLRVYWGDPPSFSPVLIFERTVSGLSTSLGTSMPIWGFTGSTGGFVSQQYFCSDQGVSLNGVLPIQLLRFEAEQIYSKVRLTWSTILEENNEKFIIERSKDAQNFIALGEIPGALHHLGLLEYEAWDDRPTTGLNYYRLKQVDLDGSFSYSPIRFVEYASSDAFQLRIYPNPLAQGKNLSFSGSDLNWLESFDILDARGNRVYSGVLPANIESSSTSVPVELPNLAPGLYLLRAKGQNRSQDLKMIVH